MRAFRRRFYFLKKICLRIIKACKQTKRNRTGTRRPNVFETAVEFLVTRRRVVFPLLVAVTAFIVYANTFHVPFQYDDSQYIVDNPGIKTLGFNQFPTLFGATRQIAFLSFYLNYRIAGFNVLGFHVVNVLIHVANSMLVYWLVLLTLKTPFFASRLKRLSRLGAGLAALFAGLLFAAHPVQTQAVTYITQRFASLATLFYLASLVLYVKARIVPREEITGAGEGGWKPAHTRLALYSGAVVCALLSMRTKEISFTLPAVIALYEFTFFAGNIKNRIIGLLPIAVTWLMIPLVLLSRSGSAGDTIQVARGEAAHISSADYLLTQFRVIVTYIRLFFFPVNQNLDYDYPLYKSFTNPNVFLSLILLASIAGLGIYLFRRSGRKNPWLRLTAFGIFWFFITLAVESSVNPLGTLIDEHRLYLASVGPIVAVIGIIWTAWESGKDRWPNLDRAAIPAGFLVIALLAGMTLVRNTVWHDELSLWQDTVAKSPGKVRPHYNLANYYVRSGSVQKGIGELRTVLEIQPNFEPALNNLGTVYMNLGQYDKAATTLEQALAPAPGNVQTDSGSGAVHLEADPVIDHFPVLSNLGICYMKLERYDKAAETFAQAISLDPSHWETHYNLGISYQKTGKNSQAIAELQAALRINPGLDEAQRLLRELLLAQG